MAAEEEGPRVLLVGNYAFDRQHSMQRYAGLLQQELSAHLGRVHLIAPRRRLPPIGGEVGKWIGHLEKYLVFGLELAWRSRAYDVVHLCDSGNALYLWLLPARRTVVTCHDCIAIRAARGEVPGVETRWTGRLAQRLILGRLKAARHVVCVSGATRSDLARLTGRPESDFALVPNVLAPIWWPTSAAAGEARPRQTGRAGGSPHFIHVGSDVWYKNRAGVLRIYARLIRRPGFGNHRLVLVGPPPGPAIMRLADDLGIRDRLVIAGEAGDADLQALYASAEALLFPSLMEGFGWPILEAQASGCPVVTSDLDPMRWVGGDGAILVDPDDPDGAAAIVAEALRDRDRLVAAGTQNLGRFARPGLGEALLALYRRIERRSRHAGPVEAADHRS